MHGLSTIRAFKMEKEFQAEFDNRQNTHSAAYFTQQIVTRWLLVVAQTLTVLYFACIAIYLMLHKAGKIAK